MPKIKISQAILTGLADDGGLFIPETIPQIDQKKIPQGISFPEFADLFLQAFFEGDELQKHVSDMCSSAFNFPIKISSLGGKNQLLELYHGPTSAFKDVGARFLSECLQKLSGKLQKELLILVATSGDTGGAVASAFYKKRACRVGLLFPKAGVSPSQKAQLTCWGENIQSFEVSGSFDDCQRLVKSAFQNQALKDKYYLTSANSINIARLLPQAAYYAYSSKNYFDSFSKPAKYIVPTGNMGNVYGAFLAKACGFPIAEIVIATNANKTISDFYTEEVYKPRASIKTLANAMDVGAPSNMERIQYMYRDISKLKQLSSVILVTDSDIQKTIKNVHAKDGIVICPHTATAFFAKEMLDSDGWILVATAHPAKFTEVIEPLIQQKIDVPDVLNELTSRPKSYTSINAQLDELLAFL